MNKFDHRYLLSIIDVFEDESTNSFFIFTPFAQYGCLQKLLLEKKINYNQILICFHQIAEGLKEMHLNNIVHRDIKPDNILCFAEDYYVLSDFSESSILNSSDEKFINTKGSPAFFSPEICLGEPYPPKATDVWAYGISFYYSLFGILPFNLDSSNSSNLPNSIMLLTNLLQTENLKFPNHVNNSDLIQDLLTKILNKNFSNRITFEEIVNHSIFENARIIDQKNILEDLEFSK